MPPDVDPGGGIAWTRAWRILAVLVPVAYAVLYVPYGMDETDFGFFYGYAWRVICGEVPYRDFYYLTPPATLYWQAFWQWLTPDGVMVLAGKLGAYAEMLASAWMGALFLRKAFDLRGMGVNLPCLATLGFVWGVHVFPAMPWHTVDGVFFGTAALAAAIHGFALPAGVLAGVCMLTKQSFLFVPVGVLIVAGTFHGRWKAVQSLAGTLALLALHVGTLKWTGAWDAFRSQTTGQLRWEEALDSGILIYLNQNFLLPLGAMIPWLLRRRFPDRVLLPWAFSPIPLYFLLLAGDYCHMALTQKTWIGYGLSWPTLFVVAGGCCVLFPLMLEGVRRDAAPMKGAVALGAALLLSWSVAVSGGYKIPALCAWPLLFVALVLHRRLCPSVPARWIAVVALVCGLAMFRVGFEYPYVFPVRPLTRVDLVHDAGDVYPKAAGVKVDAVMYGKLKELKDLRRRYGPVYKTFPAMPLAYCLNGDRPVFPSEWVMDWWIDGQVEKVYGALVERDVTVFYERDQMGVEEPDGYASRRYSVPLKVQENWTAVETGEYFVVFRRPGDAVPQAGEDGAKSGDASGRPPAPVDGSSGPGGTSGTSGPDSARGPSGAVPAP
jgi:hypothetical protein